MSGRRRREYNLVRFCACGHTLWTHPDPSGEKKYPCNVRQCGCRAYSRLSSLTPEYRQLYIRHRRDKTKAARRCSVCALRRPGRGLKTCERCRAIRNRSYARVASEATDA